MTLEELERCFIQAVVDDYQQDWDELRRQRRCVLWEHAVAASGVPQYLGSHATRSPKCTFSSVVVPIDSKRFLESDVTLVECPDCAATRTLEPHGGVLRFKYHDKRKTATPNTEPRWARGETDWDVVGRERERTPFLPKVVQHDICITTRTNGSIFLKVSSSLRWEQNVFGSSQVIHWWLPARFPTSGPLSEKDGDGFWWRFSPRGKWRHSSAK